MPTKASERATLEPTASTDSPSFSETAEPLLSAPIAPSAAWDVFDEAPIGQYLLAPDGTILRANRMELEMLGYSPREFVGRNIAEFHTDQKFVESKLADLFSGMKIYHREATLIAKDGSMRYVLISGSAIKKADTLALGKPYAHAHCYVRDVTEHKMAEKALREMNRNKDEFLATLAHELRNPLAPIRSAVEILNLMKPDSETQWALDIIDRQMHQMTRLIDDLLDIARITSGKLELHKERVELSEVLKVAFETSRPLIERAGHTLVVEVPPEPIYLSGDLIRLAQVISNLLGNAAKYTREGGTITFTAQRQGNNAVLAVCDTGLGIASDMLPRIFDLFTQGHPSGKRGGLGIGLTLVKRLVEMHGGTVSAHSEGEKKGSTFTITLPIETDPGQRLYRPTYDRERVASRSSLKILVVDDNVDAAATLEKMLTMAGNQIAVAHDGAEAVEKAGTFMPEVVLLDIDLPKMTGYEVAQAIRREFWGAKMVIVAVSGFGLTTDKARSKEAGFNHHLVKPVDPASLLQLLTSIERSGGKLPAHIL